MPDNLDLQSPQESSTQGLLAEHARIAELYLYNREMGEKRLYERRSFAIAQRQASRKVRFPQGGGRPRAQEQDEDTDL